MAEKICISCKRPVANDRGAVEFKCPNCGEYTIVRCSHCRSVSAKYQCPKCRFTGPN